MRRSRERRLTVGWGKMIGGGGTAIRMPVRVVLRRVEVDTQLQGGVGRKGSDLVRCEGEARQRQGEERVLERLL
jgi:hypothetical protein